MLPEVTGEVLSEHESWAEFAVRKLDFKLPDGRDAYIKLNLYMTIFGWRVYATLTYANDSNPIPNWNLCLGMHIDALNIMYNIVHGVLLAHIEDIKMGKLPDFTSFSRRPIPLSDEWSDFIVSHHNYIKVPEKMIIFTAEQLTNYRHRFRP